MDPNNIRIAWGTVNGMEKTLERMANMVHKKSIVDVEDELISIKKLYDQGVFTKEEFELKKREILSQIK